VIVYNKKILIIDSEIGVQQLIAAQLAQLGYKIVPVSNGKEALTTFNLENPDLVIIDILLSESDGYSVCQKIREKSQVPILIVTGAKNISDRILGFDIGADDYIIKPFFSKELEVRVRALLRRSNCKKEKLPKAQQKTLIIHNLIIETNTRVISRDNSKIKLTELEYALLELLIKNSGKELSRTMILRNVWGYTPERYVDTRIVDVHISRLRSKIEKNPSNPDLILTVRGIGYMFRNY
jgi:OmpR family response regulator RpaB